MNNKGPIGFARFTSLFMSVFIGIVLGIVLLVLGQDVSAMSPEQIVLSIVQSLAMSIPIGYAVSDFLPSMQIGERLADAIGAKSVARHLVVSLVLGVVNITIILALCMIIVFLAGAGFSGAFGAFASLWLPAVIAGTIAIAVTLPLAKKIASAISGFSPAEA